MADYRLYEKIQYSNRLLIDNTVRIIFREYVNRNANYFFRYSIQNSQRPEHIAFDFYGDARLHWIILLANNIIDPFHDWPMDYSVFLAYLENKYLPENLEPHDWNSFIDEDGNPIPDPGNDLDRAKYGITNLDFYLAQIREYRKDGVRIKQPGNIVDQNLFGVTNFMFEEQLNEDKRLIQIPLPELIDTVERDLIRLLGN